MENQARGCLWILLLSVWLGPVAPAQAEPADLFASLTLRVQNQIRSDKQGFAEAQTCTEWFYKERLRKPAKPKAEGVAYRQARSATGAPDCVARYPGGLEAAREDFSRAQSSLTISLTFYEFVLVGDRNDDGRYSAAELQDVLESIGLSFSSVVPQGHYLVALDAKFDAIRKAGNLEGLMAGLGVLYDRGYRLSPNDLAALTKVSG
jgi:hypothetical protein